MDSGGDSSSDDSSSDTGHETSSATSPTCVISPGFISLNEGKRKTVLGGEGAGGDVAPTLNLQNSSWLNIDPFPDNSLGFEDSAAEDKYQKIGNIEDKSESHGAKDGQTIGGSQEMDYNVHGAGDGHRSRDGLEHSREDIIADPDVDGVELDGDRSYSKGGHRAGAGGGAEGWC